MKNQIMHSCKHPLPNNFSIIQQSSPCAPFKEKQSYIPLRRGIKGEDKRIKLLKLCKLLCTQIRANKKVFLLILSFFLFKFAAHAQPVDVSSLTGKVICGYQGWFNCYGDNAPVQQWVHWSQGSYQSATPNPSVNNLSFELYPDITDYPDEVLFQSGFASLGDNRPARLFSSAMPNWLNTPDESSAIFNVSGPASGGLPDFNFSTIRSKTGGQSLRLQGNDNVSNEASFCYFKVFDVDIQVSASTWLSFQTFPETELSRSISIDFVMTDGSTLRDSGAEDINGISMHPGAGKGTVGEWTEISCEVGLWLQGKTKNGR